MANMGALISEADKYGDARFAEGAASRDEEVAALTQKAVDLDTQRLNALQRVGELAAELEISEDLAEELQRKLDALMPPPAIPLYNPISTTREKMAADLKGLPAGLTYVVWDDVYRPGDDLATILDRHITDGKALVLPERDEPYWLDCTKGFFAAGVSKVTTVDGTQPVDSSRNYWFAMARCKGSIVGLGPRAVIDYKVGTWKSPRQPRPTSSGEVGRFWWNKAGIKQELQLIGCQEKLIESENPNSYFGNFTLAPAPDFGGIAYHGLALQGGTVERIGGAGSWRGFAGVPNGEAGMISFHCKGRKYRVLSMDMDGRDPRTGKRVGSSQLMINTASGGEMVDVRMLCPSAGMPTVWSSSGKHVWTNVESLWPMSQAVNLEGVEDGFELVWTGGKIYQNRGGVGSKGPSPDGVFAPGSMHLGIDAKGRATVRLVDVDIDDLSRNTVFGGFKGLLVQKYGNAKGVLDVKATKDGVDIPVKVYS